MIRHLTVRLVSVATCFFCNINAAFSQANDSIPQVSQPTVSLSGFVDVFYAYDFNKPIHTDSRQPFLYNHNRHSEVNLNLGLMRLSVEHAKYRANLALQAGTYAEDNYAAEQDMLKHVFEANAGVSLNSENTLWLDAGVLGSHIGFESAISTENLTLTRSLLAENSPYFLTGARLSYEPNTKWLFAALVTNGWQRIRRVQGSSLPSFGTQVSYTRDNNFILNWSTLIGTDDPDVTRRMRYFNNFYGQFFLSSNLTLVAGFDVGFQQQQKGSSSYDWWYSPVLITHYRLDEQWAVALRAEHYSDKNEVIISNFSPEQFKATGFSANIDYSPVKNIVCRLEGRWLQSPNRVFHKESGFVNSNAFIVGSMAVKIGS